MEAILSKKEKDFTVDNKAFRVVEIFLFGLKIFSYEQPTTNSSIVKQLKEKSNKEVTKVNGFKNDK